MAFYTDTETYGWSWFPPEQDLFETGFWFPVCVRCWRGPISHFLVVRDNMCVECSSYGADDISPWHGGEE